MVKKKSVKDEMKYRKKLSAFLIHRFGFKKDEIAEIVDGCVKQSTDLAEFNNKSETIEHLCRYARK
jgi:hypothetical protein